MGTGGWSLLAPLRFVLSLLYGIHSRSTQPSVSHSSTSQTPSPDSHTTQIPVSNSKTPVSAVSDPSPSGPEIISVGNIEVGGGGKTPCVLAIASALRAEGFKPAVVTRGYGGTVTQSGGTVALPDGYGGSEEDASRELGDEAVLYLGAGLPLAVDRNRSRGIKAISDAAEPTHIILDDAFHRMELPKDLDILLLDAERPFGNGRLLPYGSLREPASAVKRAGAIIFTRAVEEIVPREAEQLVAGKPVFFSQHIPDMLSDRSGQRFEPGDLAEENIALFSGIARPASFENTAVEFGLVPQVSFRYDDHHIYSTDDVVEMIRECAPGTAFVTTAKDWSKVSAIFPEETRLLRLDMAMEIQGIRELLAPVL